MGGFLDRLKESLGRPAPAAPDAPAAPRPRPAARPAARQDAARQDAARRAPDAPAEQPPARPAEQYRNVAQVYRTLGLPPPPGASSAVRVECWNCKDVHAMRDRVEHNGTYSRCPKCKDDMYTLPMGED